MKKISTSELQVLRVIWDYNANDMRPSLKDIVSEYNLRYRKNLSPLALQTISTFLARTVKKGYATCYRDGRHFLYEAVVSPNDYRNLYLSDILELLYGDKAEAAMAALKDIS